MKINRLFTASVALTLLLNSSWTLLADDPSPDEIPEERTAENNSVHSDDNADVNEEPVSEEAGPPDSSVDNTEESPENITAISNQDPVQETETPQTADETILQETPESDEVEEESDQETDTADASEIIETPVEADSSLRENSDTESISEAKGLQVENVGNKPLNEANETNNLYSSEPLQKTDTASLNNVSIFYSTHLSNTGWTADFKNGDSSAYGRIEALSVRTDSLPENLSVKYQVHVQNIGWMNTVEMNELAGTTGRSLQIEAVRIFLSGSQSKNYNVFYRSNVNGYGWTDWAVNGKTSGSEGFGKPLNQIQIKILRSDDTSIAPGLAPRINDIGLRYNAHVQNIGWQGYNYSPVTAGTTGRALRMEALVIKLSEDLAKTGGLTARGHVQNLGWISALSSNDGSCTIGTVGQSLRLEAVELSLTGELEKHYDLLYRTHVQQLGWLGWAANGEPAGSSGRSLAIEAIEIKLVSKGSGSLLLSGTPAFNDGGKTGFCTEVINGKKEKVYYDENHQIVKKGFKLNQTYYQVDESTGAVIHEQKLFTDKIYMEGIDISHHNGNIDLSKYQNGFVIIRIGWWTQEDRMAKRNMDLCEKYNIPYGVYLYDYTTETKEVLQEAEFVLKMIKGRNIRCGVWFDMEDADGWKERNGLSADAARISRLCRVFCNRIQKAGYHAGIYASYSWFENYIHDVDQFDKWVAHWGDNDGDWNIDLSGYASLHQYTSKDGLDRNVMYVDPYSLR